MMIGVSPILVRAAGVPGPVAAFYRVALAAVLLSPVFFVRLRRGARISARGIRLAAIGGAFFAADLAAWSTGVVLSGATNPTLLVNTAPLWVGLGTLLIFREKLSGGFWAGLALAMAGAATVLGLDVLRDFEVGLGTMLGLLAGVFYGSYFLVTQRGRVYLDALSYLWISSVVDALLLLALNGALSERMVGFSGRTVLLLVALALGPQLLGWLAVNYAQGHLPASLVSPTLLGQPVVTAILAGPLLGERLLPLQIVGGAAVLAGVYWVHRSRLRPEGRPPTDDKPNAGEA